MADVTFTFGIAWHIYNRSVNSQQSISFVLLFIKALSVKTFKGTFKIPLAFIFSSLIHELRHALFLTNVTRKLIFNFQKYYFRDPLGSIIINCRLLPFYILTKSYLVLLTFGICLGIGLICIVPLPFRTGIGYTDGYRYYRIKTKSKIYD